MSTYMESVLAQSETQIAVKVAERDKMKAQVIVEWTERLTPLEDRLSKLLVSIPAEIKDQGIQLIVLRSMLAGRWRGKCHPGDLGTALRKLGYQRRRNWSDSVKGSQALWFPP